MNISSKEKKSNTSDMKMLRYNLYLPWNVLEVNMVDVFKSTVFGFLLTHSSIPTSNPDFISNTVSDMLTHSLYHAAQHYIEIMYVMLEFFGVEKKAFITSVFGVSNKEGITSINGTWK